ncbi:MAG: DUF1080 domain-containing protein [Reichenbachiella sp.]
MKYLFLLLAAFTIVSSFAQTNLPLEDLTNFNSQAGNWQIVGTVIMDRNITDNPQLEVIDDKKKKKKSKEEPPQAVKFESGTGILLNRGNQQKNDNLITTWEHGDIMLEFDVMLPKGSNSGIYLQGRYEVQLYDSWGVKKPKYSDMGGIYRNWDTAPGKKLIGIPPTSNASKAPGLWQHMKIRFKAPKFDSDSTKIKNAMFELVELNGVAIHRNVEVALPTGGPIENNEVEKGPLMIQGDHGQVAFKNIEYTLLEDSQVTLSGITYKSYKGQFKSLEQVKLDQPVSSGKSDFIDISLTAAEDNYGILFEGNINVPIGDLYNFSVGFGGGFRLIIDGQTICEVNSSAASSKVNGEIQLEKGMHNFQLLNIKSAGWRQPRLGLFVQTNSTSGKRFHHYDSYPETVGLKSSILINPDQEPKLLRAFTHFKNQDPKLSHTIGIGHPDKINCIYNLQTSNIIGVWRGDFVDATPMWNSRGNGSFKPNGAVTWTFLDQPFAKLETRYVPFPKYDNASIQQEGYSIDPQNGLPIFKYTLNGIKVESKVEPNPASHYWIQTLSFKGENLSSLYFKLAEGKIIKMEDGTYAINDQEYYLKMLSNQVPFERTIKGKTELVLPLNGLNVKYEIVW